MVKYTLILLLLAGVFCNESKPSLFSRLKLLKCAFPPREILDQLPPACKSEDLPLSKVPDKPFAVNKEFYLCIGLLEIGEGLCELAKESPSFSSSLSTYFNKTIKESPPNIVEYCTEGKHSVFNDQLKYEGSRVLFKKITDPDTCMFVCADQKSPLIVSPICKALFHGNDVLQQAIAKSSSKDTAREDMLKSMKPGSLPQQQADQQSQPLPHPIVPQPPQGKEAGSEPPQRTDESRAPSQPGKNVDQLPLSEQDQDPLKSDDLKPVESGLSKKDSAKTGEVDLPNPQESEALKQKQQDSVAQKPPQDTELEGNHNMEDGENPNKGEPSDTDRAEDKAPESNVGAVEKSSLTPKEQSAKDRNSNAGGSNSAPAPPTSSSGNVQSVLKSVKSDNTDSTNVDIKDENIPADENVIPDKMDQNNPSYQGGLDAGTEDDGTNVEDDPSVDDDGEIRNGPVLEEGKASIVDGSQIGSGQKDVPIVPPAEPEKSNVHHETYSQFVEAEDSHFFTYFLIGSLLCIIGYLLYHNKRKIIAMAVEGKKGRNSGRRRPHSASYHKLDSNLEEAMSSNFTSSNSYVIY